MLAKKGFYYVSMDCKGHGERKDENESNRFTQVFPKDTGLDTYVHMHEVIEQTAIDIKNLIENFKDIERIDTNKIGLSSFSMGGYATFYIAANNSNIKVAIPIAGKPSFTKAWLDSITSTATYEQWSTQIHNAEKKLKSELSTFNN